MTPLASFPYECAIVLAPLSHPCLSLQTLVDMFALYFPPTVTAFVGCLLFTFYFSFSPSPSFRLQRGSLRDLTFHLPFAPSAFHLCLYLCRLQLPQCLVQTTSNMVFSQTQSHTCVEFLSLPQAGGEDMSLFTSWDCNTLPYNSPQRPVKSNGRKQSNLGFPGAEFYYCFLNTREFCC